jgi:hypothetical protein
VLRVVKAQQLLARRLPGRGEGHAPVESLFASLRPERPLAVDRERVAVRKAIAAERIADEE